MERSEIVASLRLVAQEFEAGDIDGVICVSVYKGGEPSSLAWPGENPVTLLGAISLAKDFLSEWFNTQAKERGLKG